MIIVPAYCMRCTHFDGPMKDGKHISCEAYPNGIPNRIVSGKIAHTEVREDQKGEYVYEE